MAKREELLNWARAFDEQSSSVKAYCAEAGVSTTKFYYWRRQLAEEPVEDTGFTSLSISRDIVPGLVLRLPGGVEIACEDLDQDRFIELAVKLDRQYAQVLQPTGLLSLRCPHRYAQGLRRPERAGPVRLPNSPAWGRGTTVARTDTAIWHRNK